jgi:hypothetical protein
MANYVPSDLVKGQGLLSSKFNSGELRFREPVTFMEFVRQSNIMFPIAGSLRTREDRAVSAYFKNRTSRALGSTRTHNHTGTKGDSTELALTWDTKDDKFAHSLKQADANLLSLPEMMSNELENVVGNFAEGLETDAVNYLFNNRSGVNGGTSEGTFDATDDTFEIASADINRAVQITKSNMKENKYHGVYTIFCDTVSFNKFEEQANQGTGNSTNLSFQYSGVQFVHSIELGALGAALVSAYAAGYWIAVPEGMISALDWIPVQNRQGISTKENMYGTFINPVDGLTYAVHSYEQRADESASGGYTQDVLTEVEISVDIDFEHAPLTAAGETPLLAFAIV